MSISAFVVAGGLVSSGHSLVIVLSIDGHMLLVLSFGAELLASFDDEINSLFVSFSFSHLVSGVVSVKSGSVPVSLVRLRVKGNVDLMFLSDSVKDVSSNGQVISHLYSVANSDLEFPLRRHDLSIDSADLESSSEAQVEVLFSDLSSEGGSSSGGAVVRSLLPSSWGSVSLPQERNVDEFHLLQSSGVINERIRLLLSLEENVLLLHTELRGEGLGLGEDFEGNGSAVGSVRGSVWVQSFCKNQFVRGSSEWVVEYGDWLDEDI